MDMCLKHIIGLKPEYVKLFVLVKELVIMPLPYKGCKYNKYLRNLLLGVHELVLAGAWSSGVGV